MPHCASTLKLQTKTCRQDGLVPKGLKINTQVHPTRGDRPSHTPNKIDSILKRAEQDMVDTLVAHYRQVSKSTMAKLGDIERDLESTPEEEQSEISIAADRSTRNEDDLKSSLERTRRSKLSTLHNTHHHRPPVSSGAPPAMGPLCLWEDKLYGRVNREWSPQHAPRVHPSPAHTCS